MLYMANITNNMKATFNVKVKADNRKHTFDCYMPIIVKNIKPLDWKQAEQHKVPVLSWKGVRSGIQTQTIRERYDLNAALS